MVTEVRHEKLGAQVLKNKSEIAVAPAFEELVSQLAYTQAAVHMRLTKTIN